MRNSIRQVATMCTHIRCRSATLLHIEIHREQRARLMYGYISKTKQSLALKLMAIYTLKSNILVYFSHLNYLLVLSCFKSLYFHFCESALNSYRFIHYKFSIQIPYRFSLRFALNSFSALHQNCYLKRD